MAEFSSSSSTLSTPRRKWKYGVFLSFRGEDTRYGFTDHLYNTLKKKGIHAFMDKDGLESGQVISQKLLQAIEQSLCAVVILSKNYASSSWCLDELKKIMEFKPELGQIVLPVFYGIDPSVVRRQTGDFGESFKKLEERYKEKMHDWRVALTDTANLSGLCSINRYETDLIEDIAEKVCAELHHKLPSTYDGLVGIGPRVEEMKSLLKRGLDDVCFVGIWGMGGRGKTTLASIVYNEIQSEFDISCFLAKVRENSEQHGLVHLQRKLLSSLKHRNFELENEYQGKEKIQRFLCHMKVLLVLDDISEKEQLDNLAGNKKWFGPGSRVIITTRDKHLLTPQELFDNYDIQLLNSDDSLKLFCQKAFNKDQPEAGYLELCKGIVNHSGRLPLALKVMGSFLCGRSLSGWEEALNRMKQNPENDIHKTLQISYDGLNMKAKAMFLDIACFFHNMEENMLKTLLKDCGHEETIDELDILIEKTLLSYEKPYICMHDLFQQLGKNIVVQESLDEASERSRLWSLEDVDQVLRKNKGTDKTKGILFFLAQPHQADWSEDCFTKMSGLRFLVIKGPGHVHLSRDLISLPSSLRVLDWEGYPLKTLPGTQLDELVYLKLTNSKLTQLWNRKQFIKLKFIKLKVINLSHSKDLTRTPDFDGIPNLEFLILAGCENLIEVHQSFGKLEKLVKVYFTGCKNLETLPSKLSMNSLQAFSLSGCLKLKKLPEFGENMQSLSLLLLEETAIEDLPPSLGFLTGLSILNLKGCKNLVSFPNTMCNLKSLRILNICFCSKISSLPENLSENVHLEELHAVGSGIREIPLCIVHLKNLKSLILHGCKGTKFIFSSLRPLPLPRSFSGLSLLRELSLCYCDLRDESIPGDFSCLSSLWRLSLGGNYFVNLPIGCLSKLPKLEQLDMFGCPKLLSLPELPPNLAFIDATGCYSMEPLLDPQQLWNIFATHDFQNWHTLCLAGDFTMFINGDEISSWFHNRNYRYEDTAQSRYDKGISITMDIPHGYLDSGEWSGIAVCLVLEELSHDPECLRSIHWSFKSPESEGIMGITRKWVGFDQNYDGPKLFIAFFPFTNSNCLQHLTGKINQQLQLTICTKRDSMVTGAPLRMHGVIGIRECGWRLLCKEDFEAWGKTMGGFNASSASADNEIIPSSGLKRSADNEIIPSSSLKRRSVDNEIIPSSGLKRRSADNEIIPSSSLKRRVTKVSNDDKCQDEFKGKHQSQTSFIVEEAPRSFFKTYAWQMFLVSLVIFILVGFYIFSLILLHGFDEAQVRQKKRSSRRK